MCRIVEAYWGSGWRNLKQRGHLVDPDVEGSITLRWIVRKWVVVAWTRLIWFRVGAGGGHWKML